MVAIGKKHPELEKLEAEYPLGTLQLSTIEGQRWRRRMDESQAYYNEYSGRFGWAENQILLSDFRALEEKYGTYVALPNAIAQNFVADTYFRNPDPLIQDKGGNRDLSKILSDVLRSIHQEVDSERKMKDALTDQWWAGFGCVWASFRQESYEAPVVDDFGQPAGSETVPTKQQVLLKQLSPYQIRFDPKGRDWDLSDHRYVAVEYIRSLAASMRDPRLSEEDKRRVMASFSSGNIETTYETATSNISTGEDDPEFIQLKFWQIWDRTTKKVYDLPMGAQFTLSPQDWPEEFAEADVFPLRYMPANREAQDQGGKRGFIGIPYLTLIRPHIYAIQKLEALFLAANQHVINKYLMPKGALDEAAKNKLADGTKQFAVVEWDSDALNAFPAEMRDKFRSDEILQLVKQGDLKELHHLEGIRHEMDLIAQIVGQASGDRGGLSKAKTATESMGMQRGLERRRSNAIHVNGKHYNAVTKLFFLILKQRQTLPIRYQMTTNYNEQVWAEFNADALKDLDLHFDYATGSSEPRTREEEFALRERMAAQLLPVLQANGDVRGMRMIARDLTEVLNIKESEKYFNDELVDAMKELVALQNALGKGLVDPGNPQVAARQMELIAIAAQATLTERDLAEVAASAANMAPPSPSGQGSLPAAPSPGAQAHTAAAGAGSAAAGVIGGTPN
jgi:hypothetical protein